MGNTTSHPDSDSAVLVHSFQLDADFDLCQLPWICPRRNAMFHPPSSLPEHVQEFLPLEEARSLLADLNHILHTTAFNPRVNNPCFCLACLASFGTMGFVLPVFVLSFQPEEDGGSTLPLGLGLFLLIGLTSLPYIIFFFLVFYMKRARRRRLLGRVEEWNGAATGVRFSFGGGGTTPQGVTIGSQFGGTYDNFYMATWDPKGLLFKGYLHVFVHTEERQEWCRTSGRPYAPPAPLGQAPAVAHQPPAGFALVPTQEAYQPPPGYALVPINEARGTEEPPSYTKAMA